MPTTIQDTILETLDMETLESLLVKLREKKIEDKQNSNRQSITTIQNVRSRLDRLNTLFREINFTLLWKDRVCKALGKDADSLRWELYRHRSNNMVGKSTASFYEAVSFNHEYLQVAINTVITLEKERGIKSDVYYENSMTKEQEKEFCIDEVAFMTNIEFNDWFSRRLDDFALMFGVRKYRTPNNLLDKSAESYFWKALALGNALYDKRIYGDRFDNCGFELCHGVEFDLEKVYNCETVTPCYKIPKAIIREYIVVVARRCLVV